MQVFRIQRVHTTLFLSALLLGLGSACAAPRAESGGASKPTAKPSKAEEQAEKREKLEAELVDARAALTLAELEVAADTLAATEALDDARREVDEAQLDLKRFRDVELPSEIADGQLGIERSMQHLTESRQELAQMEAMYAAEANLGPSGESTRDMVLERHRKSVEFATRALELARTRYQDEVNSKLPKQQRDLEHDLREAERELRKAEKAQTKDGIESERSLTKARRAVSEAERNLAKLDSGEQAGAAADVDGEDE